MVSFVLQTRNKRKHIKPFEGLNITSGFAFIDECQVFPSAEVAYKALGRLRSGPSPCLVMVGLPVSRMHGGLSLPSNPEVKRSSIPRTSTKPII